MRALEFWAGARTLKTAGTTRGVLLARCSCTRYTSRRGRPARADTLDTCGSIRSASWAQPLRVCCAWLSVRFSRDIALREDARDRFGLAFDHLQEGQRFGRYRSEHRSAGRMPPGDKFM